MYGKFCVLRILPRFEELPEQNSCEDFVRTPAKSFSIETFRWQIIDNCSQCKVFFLCSEENAFEKLLTKNLTFVA